MVTGQTVFAGTELYEILHKIANAETDEAVQQVGQRIPRLVPLLERAFLEQPDDRYPDAEAMRKDLLACLRDLDGDEELGPWLDTWMATDPQEDAATIANMPSRAGEPNLAGAIDYEQAKTMPSAQVDIPPTAATPLDPPVKVQRTMPMVMEPPPANQPPAATPEALQAQPAQRPARWPLFMVTGAIIALGVAAGVAVIGAMLGPRLLGDEDDGDPVVVVAPAGDGPVVEPRAGTASDAPPAVRDDATTSTTPAPAAVEDTPTRDTEDPTQEDSQGTDETAASVAPVAPPEADDSGGRVPVINQAAPPAVLGGLSALDVGGPISLQQAAFEACYRTGLQRDSDLAGSLQINLAIEPTGTVGQVQVSGGTMRDAGVQACFSRVLSGVAFAAPSDKQVAIVEYTFILESEDPP